MNRLLSTSLLAVWLAACGHASTKPQRPAKPAVTLETHPEELFSYTENATIYTVGSFDRVRISIWRYEDLSGEMLVKEDGTIFVPNVGAIMVAGLTLRQAQERLTKAVGSYVNDPQVDIQPVEVRSKRFYLSGAFKNPGAYPVYRPLTVAEAVTLAGGTNGDALVDGALLSRRGRVHPLSIDALYTPSDQLIYIQANDVLYVPSRSEATVFVLGEVTRPGSYPLHSMRGLPLLQAIAQAGGFTLGADEDEVAVVRRNGDRLEMYVVEAGVALDEGGGSAAAFVLRPGDIVWVPPSGIGSWNRAMELLNPTLDTLLLRPLSGVRDFFWIKDFMDND